MDPNNLLDPTNPLSPISPINPASPLWIGRNDGPGAAFGNLEPMPLWAKLIMIAPFAILSGVFLWELLREWRTR